MELPTTTDARSEIVFVPPTVDGPQIMPPREHQIVGRDGVEIVVSLTKAKTP